MTDSDLIHSILCGDRSAGEMLVDRYRGLIWSAVSRFGLPEDQSEDLFQRVFERLWDRDCRCLREWKGEGALASYLYRIARNLCLDSVRSQKREGVVSSVQLDSEVEWVEIPVEDPGPGPAELTELGVCQEAVRAALEKLPSLDREVLRLYYLDGMKQREVAGVVGRDVKQVGSLIVRALKKIKKVLDRDCPGLF